MPPRKRTRVLVGRKEESQKRYCVMQKDAVEDLEGVEAASDKASIGKNDTNNDRRTGGGTVDVVGAEAAINVEGSLTADTSLSSNHRDSKLAAINIKDFSLHDSQVDPDKIKLSTCVTTTQVDEELSDIVTEMTVPSSPSEAAAGLNGDEHDWNDSKGGVGSDDWWKEQLGESW